MINSIIGKDQLEPGRNYNDEGKAAPEAEVNENGEEVPTEEEQFDYDMLTIRAQKIMFGKGKDKILTQLGTAQVPAKGLGKVASMIIKSLMDSAKQAGKDIDPNTALHAGAEVIEDLSALAKANGVYEYDSEEEELKQMNDSLLWAVKFYGDGMIKAGEITPEMQQMAKEQVQQGLQEELNNAPKMSKEQENQLSQAVKQGINQQGGQQMQGGQGIVQGAMPQNM